MCFSTAQPRDAVQGHGEGWLQSCGSRTRGWLAPGIGFRTLPPPSSQLARPCARHQPSARALKGADWGEKRGWQRRIVAEVRGGTHAPWRVANTAAQESASRPSLPPWSGRLPAPNSEAVHTGMCAQGCAPPGCWWARSRRGPSAPPSLAWLALLRSRGGNEGWRLRNNSDCGISYSKLPKSDER